MLKDDEDRLHSRVIADISSSLLITQHTKFDIIDMLSDRTSKRIDFFILNILIQWIVLRAT